MTLPFVKMHGLGNDFLLVDGVEAQIDATWLRSRAPDLCHRHEGVGADGVLLLSPGREGDLSLTVINADGSEAEMCGNGLRCVAWHAHRRGWTRNGEIAIDTGAGLLRARVLAGQSGDEALILTELGVPRILGVKDLPAAADRKFRATCVELGNPHCVVLLDPAVDGPLAGFDVSAHGPCLEQHPLFPDRTNVEFVEAVSHDRLQQRTWERGVGETRACGTGAAAAVAAHLSREQRGEGEVTVVLAGGVVRVTWTGESDPILLVGPATHVYDGVLPEPVVSGVPAEIPSERGRR